MGRIIRKPFQGILNIIRFNWHFYVIALLLIVAMFFVLKFLPRPLQITAIIILSLAIAGITISLIVSFYIYDYSGLYSLNWLDKLPIGSDKQLVNINAGFDETSPVIQEKYPGCNLLVFDFYDRSKHTEISIERARKAYPAYPGTKPINTYDIPLKANSIDYIFLVFSAHEIRNDDERAEFFRQLGNALKKDGKIIVTEHQRDINNFIAYNIGFFHFFSSGTWKQTFTNAGLFIESAFKVTPFISTFVLIKNGTTT
jgi:SAM-dependent methyltransferase